MAAATNATDVTATAATDATGGRGRFDIVSKLSTAVSKLSKESTCASTQDDCRSPLPTASVSTDSTRSSSTSPVCVPDANLEVLMAVYLTGYVYISKYHEPLLWYLLENGSGICN